MSYWQKRLQERLSRRAALRLSGAAAGLAALSLAGCGGGEGGSEGKADTSGLVSKPVDTTNSAVKGGIYASSVSQDPNSFDGIGGNTGLAFSHANYAYSRLLKYKPAKYPARPDGSVEPDAAQSFEVSPDGLQYTFRIRPNHKYDPRPPTNGRAMTSADVKYAWDRFTQVNQGRTDLAQSASPTAPVVSVTAPDERTVLFKLAYPYAPLPTMLPYYRYMTIMPVESEGGFNIKSEMRGTGAWRLMDYKASLSVHYRKNPDWYDAAKVNFDGIDLFIVTEYATGLAQFRGGNLWSYAVRPEDLLSTKRDLPQLVMQADSAFSRSISPYVAFSILPGSPFIDDRVRKAVSMLIDRDLWIDTFYNVSNFEKEGLPVATRWNSHTPCGDEAYWLDPKGNDLGEGAKFFKHDPAEAKKLLRAAGHTSAIETSINYTPNAYGPNYLRQAEVYHGMWEAEGDFKLQTRTHDYTSVWVPTYHQGNGKYEGIVVGAISTLPDIDGTLVSNFRSGAVKTWWGLVDTKLDDIIDRQRRELDRNKRLEILREFQRYEATQMHSIISPGEALSFTLAWPWLANRGVYSVSEANSAHQESTIYLWYDASKKTA